MDKDVSYADVHRAMCAFEQLSNALYDLDLGHMFEPLLALQEQMLEELDIDDNDIEEFANSNINPFKA